MICCLTSDICCPHHAHRSPLFSFLGSFGSCPKNPCQLQPLLVQTGNPTESTLMSPQSVWFPAFPDSSGG